MKLRIYQEELQLVKGNLVSPGTELGELAFSKIHGNGVVVYTPGKLTF